MTQEIPSQADSFPLPDNIPFYATQAQPAAEPISVFILTYESGEYSDWNTQNLGVFSSMQEAEKGRDAHRAMTGGGFLDGEYVCHGAPQYPEGENRHAGEFHIEDHVLNVVVSLERKLCEHGL